MRMKESQKVAEISSLGRHSQLLKGETINIPIRIVTGVYSLTFDRECLCSCSLTRWRMGSMIVVVVVTDASDITYPDRKSIPVKLSRLHRVCMHGNTGERRGCASV